MEDVWNAAYRSALKTLQGYVQDLHEKYVVEYKAMPTTDNALRVTISEEVLSKIVPHTEAQLMFEETREKHGLMWF